MLIVRCLVPNLLNITLKLKVAASDVKMQGHLRSVIQRSSMIRSVENFEEERYMILNLVLERKKNMRFEPLEDVRRKCILLLLKKM